MSGSDKIVPLKGSRPKATPRPVSGPVAGPVAGLDLPTFESGWVWLAGAGPGDPGLLTLHTVNALQQADVIVHDALVSDEILSLASPATEKFYAGKRGGKPSAMQRDISAKLIELARQGKRVLRLKGGDPFVFGRGGEEALSLVEAGIPFRVIPGVTAGIGGLAYAGIPATHRDTNHAVTFVTGHMAGGDVPENLDWAAIAKGSPAIVLFMALSHLDAIVTLLLENGRLPSEPIAFVRNASLPDQEVLEATLGTAVSEVDRTGFKGPAIIAIGEIVSMRQSLDWLGAMNGKVLKTDPLGTRSVEDTA